jgi:DHA1 family multidrug resistance protein-like MFS transporter
MPSWRRTLAIMVAVQFSTTFGFSFFHPFLPLYVRHLGSTTGLGVEVLSGLVFSGQAMTMAIVSPFWGALADRFGRKPMVIRASLGSAVTVLLMGLAQSAEQLVGLRIVQGLVSGTISASAALVASVTPREHSGYAMGMLQVGLWSGVAVGPLVGGVLSDLVGFQVTFAVTSLLLVLAGAGVWFSVDEPFVRSQQVQAGMFGFLRDWRRVLSSPRLDFTLALRFLAGLGRSTLEPVLPLFVLALAGSMARVGTSTGLVVGAASVATTVTSVWLGRLGDRVGHGRVALVSGIGTAIFLGASALVQTVWQLLVLHALAGACFGGLLPSLSALLAVHSKSGDEGCVYGIDSSMTSAGRALGPLLGAACALWFSVRMTFVLAGLVFVAASALGAFTVCRPGPDRRRDRGAAASLDEERRFDQD